MAVDPSIFKAYDIRGTVPDQLNGDLAYRIGYALASVLKPRSIAVGRDMRVSSDLLFEHLARGINDYGADVIDLGLISTDALYFAVGKFGYDGGVMVTASHNPKEYNGFKVCRKEAVPLSGQEGLNQVLRFIQDGEEMPRSPSPGVVARKDILSEYADHCLSFIDISRVREFHVVIDAGNGIAGRTVPPVLDRLPIRTTRLYFELDGTFPNHPASPIELENLADLIRAIAETGADFGAAFDGDADRMFLVDRKGRQIGGDMVTAMVAKSLLKRHPGETILYNLICSRAVPELVERMGGTAIRTRVGHALIKPLMKKHNAIFGGEHSGHFYFRDNWFADSGLIAFLVCLELLSEERRPLDEVVRDLDPYVRSGEINSRVADQKAKIEAIAEAYGDGRQDRIDGLTVAYDTFWFNLRPSNTEPLLRLNIEADSPRILEVQKAKLLGLIRS
ncbi:MAG TPA: phosphomannomutase/phosphoglucomutase [candidate division Zixibacteria bacterium]|nr:phosphomannomutase/phosphoglucomutase [candidate division Zixibacteria bacterium]MDD4917651.1 phosphomannomutase/phosphoglucomutase [candidate division Zixibacteria bacterium]MDM7974055.1 phosphomannomutase/phosphoglucomutase [candidate division Zixibacteria bacterium]HOD65531.1 phosphomannomutase/phosphoglucomutase [candidate division Zixibacteria bacterium]HPM36969.1 phosphomannomutase/phosphoglucomutase [candidate division Zixibacteria bacterium]